MTVRPGIDRPRDSDAQRVVASPVDLARLSTLLDEWLAETKIAYTHEG